MDAFVKIRFDLKIFCLRKQVVYAMKDEEPVKSDDVYHNQYHSKRYRVADVLAAYLEEPVHTLDSPALSENGDQATTKLFYWRQPKRTYV